MKYYKKLNSGKFVFNYYYFIIIVLIFFSGCKRTVDDYNKPIYNEYYSIDSPTTFTLNMRGNFDENHYLAATSPPNKRFFSSYKIVNVGNDFIINPRIEINGFKMPLTTNELLNQLTESSTGVEDSLLRIFYTMYKYGVHHLPNPNDNYDPLLFFISDFTGICTYMTWVQSNIWGLMGYKWRHSAPFNHTSGEVLVGDRPLHLDSNIKTYYLLYDNWTIASAQNIHDDPMLVLRSSNYGFSPSFPRKPDDPKVWMWYSSEKVASLYIPQKISEPYILSKPKNTEVKIILRPGESYGWDTDRRKYYRPARAHDDFARVARNIIWETELHFSRPSHRWCLNQQQLKDAGKIGFIELTKNSNIIIPYSLPWPIVGAEISVMTTENHNNSMPYDLNISSTDSRIKLNNLLTSTTLKKSTSLNTQINQFPSPTRNLKFEISYPIKGIGEGNKIEIKRIKIRIYCRSNSYACRSINVGDNTIVYSDDSKNRSVSVVVNANPEERDFSSFSENDFFPKNGEEIPEGNLKFAWKVADDSELGGYHLQISAYPDMRYPLSPSFDKQIPKNNDNIISGIFEYRFPYRGMFPVNKKLYWRVRAYNKETICSDWSSIKSFSVTGPMTPENIKITEDDNKITLSWEPSKTGTRPVLYEIHSSLLDSFIPISEPHLLMGFSDEDKPKYKWSDVWATDWKEVPSTLFTTTKDTSLILFDKQKLNPILVKNLGAHFRVIAIDKNNSQSCPSPQASLKSPLLLIPSVVKLHSGKIEWEIPYISTYGRISCQREYFLGLWNKPKLKFKLENSPTNLFNLDEDEGILRGEIKSNESYKIKISVSDQFKRSDEKEFIIKSN